MIKVLISIPASHNGGPYISHQRIFESKLLTSQIIFFSLPVYRFKKMLKKSTALEYLRIVEEYRPDIIQIYGLELAGFSQIYALRFVQKKYPRIPIVLSIHGSINEAIHISFIGKKIISFLEKRTLNQATVAYGVSNYVSKMKNVFESKKCNLTIYNIPGNPFLCERISRMDLGFEQDDFIIVSTGRIIEEKGYDIFLRIINNLSIYKDIKFLIVGDGNYLPTMKNNIKNKNNVLFVGRQQDVYKYLNVSDMFLICTKHETLCSSIVEAGSVGLPVVATNVGGIPEIITDGLSGLLAENENENDFTKKVLLYYNNRDMRKNHGENLKKHIETVFSEGPNMNMLAKLYGKVLDDKDIL